MSWKPIADVATARARAHMLDRARNYFRSQDVLEVCTPALQRSAPTDPNIASFEVILGSQPSFLHTSPEYCMKRLLAAGYPDIFQICTVFRDNESGRLHLPEFTMIEWYRIGFGLQQIMSDAVALTSKLISNLTLREPGFISYRQVFRDSMDIDPLTASAESIANALNADAGLRQSVGDDIDAWLDLAMATRIAETFPDDRLTVVFHYPASQAALARLCPRDAGVADRFEIFIGAIEIANGFVELNDSEEQLERFESDNQRRGNAGLPVHEIDANLIGALRDGMPASAGVALGLDRVLLIDEALDDIRNVMTFMPGERDDR
jgi:lysyl-tRNA synthetase class 2